VQAVRGRGRPAVAIAAVFVVNGLGGPSFLARLPVRQADLGLSDAGLGATLAVFAIGAFVASPLMGPLIGRFGSRRVVLVAGVVLGGSLPLVGAAPNAVTFALAMALTGAADAGMDIAMNANGAAHEAATGRSILHRLHGAWSLGALGAAALAGLAAATGVPLTVHLAVAGAGIVAVSVLTNPRLVRDRPGDVVTAGPDHETAAATGGAAEGPGLVHADAQPRPGMGTPTEPRAGTATTAEPLAGTRAATGTGTAAEPLAGTATTAATGTAAEPLAGTPAAAATGTPAEVVAGTVPAAGTGTAAEPMAGTAPAAATGTAAEPLVGTPAAAGTGTAAAGAGAVPVRGGGRWRGVGRLVPAPLLALSATIVGAALVEGGTSDWAALQLQRYGASAGVAALGVAAFMAGMLAGRSVGDKLDERWGGTRLLRTGGLLVAGGLAAGALLPYAAVFIAGAFVAGVGSSGFFPLAFSASARIPGVAPGVGAATVSLAARLGFTVEPALMGGIADSVGLRWAYGMVAAIGLVMALAAGRVVPAEATSRGR